jgi:hypothetical protein
MIYSSQLSMNCPDISNLGSWFWNPMNGACPARIHALILAKEARALQMSIKMPVL